LPSPARFASVYLYVAAMGAALWLHGPWVLLPVALTFVVIPILDALAGTSAWNPDPAEAAALADDARYRWLTWAWLPFGIALTILTLMRVVSPDANWAERIGLVFALGFTNGIGIVFAHELVHRPGRFEQFLGEAILTIVSYAHFRVEHVFGHHRFVATPRDPATARYGENVYTFIPRSVAGQLASAWQLEGERLARRGDPVWSARNRMIWYAVALLAAYAGVGAFFGPLGLVFFALQGCVAFASLEVVNYLEHYGLARREIAPGKYETTQPRHSWNSAHRVTNWYYINLARHSDHHAFASRRYQLLRTYGDEHIPQLPYGYPSMYLLALVPPLWFRTMNPRVQAWRERNAQAA
jgi:alkane 1-monooxygenase